MDKSLITAHRSPKQEAALVSMEMALNTGNRPKKLEATCTGTNTQSQATSNMLRGSLGSTFGKINRMKNNKHMSRANLKIDVNISNKHPKFKHFRPEGCTTKQVGHSQAFVKSP